MRAGELALVPKRRSEGSIQDQRKVEGNSTTTTAQVIPVQGGAATVGGSVSTDNTTGDITGAAIVVGTGANISQSTEATGTCSINACD